jgi:hypothetical protein
MHITPGKSKGSSSLEESFIRLCQGQGGAAEGMGESGVPEVGVRPGLLNS